MLALCFVIVFRIRFGIGDPILNIWNECRKWETSPLLPYWTSCIHLSSRNINSLLCTSVSSHFSGAFTSWQSWERVHRADKRSHPHYEPNLQSYDENRWLVTVPIYLLRLKCFLNCSLIYLQEAQAPIRTRDCFGFPSILSRVSIHIFSEIFHPPFCQRFPPIFCPLYPRFSIDIAFPHTLFYTAYDMLKSSI